MKSNQPMLTLTWLASIVFPVGVVGLGLYLDRQYLPDADEWLSVVLVMGALFAGVWIIYFFLTWITGTRLPEGSKLNRPRVALKIAVVAVLIAAAICGLLFWAYIAMIGHGWGGAFK